MSFLIIIFLLKGVYMKYLILICLTFSLSFSNSKEYCDINKDSTFCFRGVAYFFTTLPVYKSGTNIPSKCKCRFDYDQNQTIGVYKD